MPGIHLFRDGMGEFSFGDDDMFYGHFIVVYLDADGKPTEADIEGRFSRNSISTKGV